MKFGTVLLMIALVSFVGSVWGQEPTIDDLKKDNQQLKQEIIRLKKQIVKLQDVERSEEHTSELQSHSFISYAVFCLKKKII